MAPKIEIKVEKMRMPKTFILMWNPSISSYTMERFEEELSAMASGWGPDDFNWSVWDYENAREGDAFYMVKVEQDQTALS